MELPPEKMVQYVHYGTMPMLTCGTAIILSFHRHANGPALAFQALSTVEAKDHAADIMRHVIAIENGVDPASLQGREQTPDPLQE